MTAATRAVESDQGRPDAGSPRGRCVGGDGRGRRASPVLMGSFDGARSLALLAATRPERVGGLIAFSPSARGAATTSPEFADSAAQSIAEMTDWPGPLPELYAPRWAPDSVRLERFRRYIQTASTPRQAARLLR